MANQTRVTRATIPEPIVEGRPLIDVRTWFPGDDGKLKPGKGFAATIKHLPRLAAELNKALAKARELGLVDDEAGHG